MGSLTFRGVEGITPNCVFADDDSRRTIVWVFADGANTDAER